MSAPHVTITVTRDPSEEVDPLIAEQNLYMMYVQSSVGEVRYQWVVYPPALEVLGVDAQTVAKSGGRVKVLARTQSFPGNRSKWFHLEKENNFLVQTIKDALDKGETVKGPVLIPLELDDYLTVWQGETSHKAIRAIDRELIKTLNTTIKGTDK